MSTVETNQIIENEASKTKALLGMIFFSLFFLLLSMIIVVLEVLSFFNEYCKTPDNGCEWFDYKPLAERLSILFSMFLVVCFLAPCFT